MGSAAHPAQTSPSTSASTVALETVRTRLAAVWLIGALLIFSLVIYQSVAHVYADRAQDVWQWLLPTLLPTLTMMLTVAGTTAFMSGASDAIVRSSFYRVALLLSVFYLVLILFTILSLPAFNRTVDREIEALHGANLWIGPIQGIVASALGVLFASKKKSAAPGEQKSDE